MFTRMNFPEWSCCSSVKQAVFGYQPYFPDPLPLCPSAWRWACSVISVALGPIPYLCFISVKLSKQISQSRKMFWYLLLISLGYKLWPYGDVSLGLLFHLRPWWTGRLLPSCNTKTQKASNNFCTKKLKVRVLVLILVFAHLAQAILKPMILLSQPWKWYRCELSLPA